MCFNQQFRAVTFSYGLLQPKPKMSKWPCESVQAKCCPSAENLQSKIAPWPCPSIWKQIFEHEANDSVKKHLTRLLISMILVKQLPCWRSCGSWLLWSGPTCKCCHHGQQIAWCGSQMGEPPSQTPHHHDPWRKSTQTFSESACQELFYSLFYPKAAAHHRQPLTDKTCSSCPVVALHTLSR